MNRIDAEREAPDDRAPWLVLDLRPRRQRKADPVTGSGRLDAHEHEAASGRRAHLRARAELLAQARFELLHLRQHAARPRRASGARSSGTMRTPNSRPMRSDGLAPLSGVGGLERGAHGLQLRDLGVAEGADEQRGAIVAEHARSSRRARSRRRRAAGAQAARTASADRPSRASCPRGRPAPGHRRARTRSRSPTRSGCSADSPDRARSACAGATPARRSRDRTRRGRGPRASSISFSRASGWRGCCANTLTSENSPVVRWIVSPPLASVRAAKSSTKGPNAALPSVAGAPGARRSVCRRSTA